MLRVNKLTDYAVVVLCDLLRGQALRSAADLSASSGVPLPTVAKILKQLTRTEILQSARGVNGGYGFARAPQTISMAEVIEALEGPIAVTGCAGDAEECCEMTEQCPMNGHWNAVNVAVRNSLSEVRLIDMLPEARFMDPEDLISNIAARHAPAALQA
jgi:FeS assembly SUF system regulator